MVNKPEFDDIVPAGWLSWLLYGYIILVIPVVSFGITFPSVSFDAEWQSGRLSDYANIMVSGSVTPYFLPFILWPMLSMALLLFNAPYYANYFWVRWGIYSGVIVGLQYSVLLSNVIMGEITTQNMTEEYSFWASTFLIPLISYFIIMGLAYLADSVTMQDSNLWLMVVIILALIIILEIIAAMIGHGDNYFLIPPMIFGLFSLTISGPIWCTCVTLTTSRQLYYYYDKESVDLLQKIPIIWLSGYSVAWVAAVAKTFEVYRSLPTSPPYDNCYVATAAARGHGWLVRAHPISLGPGQVMWLNPQLQYLKAGELIFSATWPRGHQQLRRWYDAIGPKIAAQLTHPLLADVAYLSLLPLEWSVRGLLYFFPQLKALTQGLYNNQS